MNDLPGTIVTLAAAPDAQSVFSGWSGNACAGMGLCIVAGSSSMAVTAIFNSTGMTSPPSSPAALSLTYNGKLRDRVGQGNTALGADGALDGTLTATLSASGGRTVTALKLQSIGPGTWDTDAGTAFWALGVATALDGSLI